MTRRRCVRCHMCLSFSSHHSLSPLRFFVSGEPQTDHGTVDVVVVTIMIFIFFKIKKIEKILVDNNVVINCANFGGTVLPVLLPKTEPVQRTDSVLV